MNQDKTIVDVLKSGQIVAWGEIPEGGDSAVYVVTWTGGLTLNLWTCLAGEGAWLNSDCKTLNNGVLEGSAIEQQTRAKGSARLWLEEIRAEEEEELNQQQSEWDQFLGKPEQQTEEDEYGGEVPNIPNAMMHSAHEYEETREEIDRWCAEEDALERLPVLPDLEPPPTVRLRPQDWREPNHPTD